MKPKVLIIYSLDSPPTVVTAETARIVQEILNKKCDVHVLDPVKANNLALRFVSFLKEFDGIFYFGHGSRDKLHGQLWLGPIPVGVIRAMLTVEDRFICTKIFYAVACLSAQILGDVFTKFGNARAYCGNQYYTFIAYPSSEHNYAKDFIDSFVEFVRVLADGGTVGEAYHSMRRKMYEYIQLYRNMLDEWPNADFYLWAMKMNYEGFVLLGDKNITLL